MADYQRIRLAQSHGQVQAHFMKPSVYRIKMIAGRSLGMSPTFWFAANAKFCMI
jgi:hypothetical protein